MSLDPPRSRPVDIPFSCAAFVLALLPRLYVAVAWAREPVWDGHYYHFGATRIAAGLGYSEDVMVSGVSVWKPWCHYPVGYSALLGGLYRVFGTGLLVAPLANAVAGSLLVVVVHRLALPELGAWRARAATLLTALHPGLITYSAVLMTEQSAALLVLLAAACALQTPRWAHSRARWRRAAPLVLAGLVLGLATLVRPSTLLAAPLVALLRPGAWRRAAEAGLIVTSVALLSVLPWTLRNCRVMDGCALVSTNGGWNLAIGALTETGRFHTLRASDGCRVVTGQVQQDRCWSRVGRARILSDPAHWLALIPKKLSQTYDHESFAIEYLHEADPAAWPEPRRLAAREALTLFHRLLLLGASLGVVGAIRPRRDPARVWLVQLAVAAALCGYALHALLGDEHPFYVLAVVLPLVPLCRLPGAPRLGALDRYLLGLIFATNLTHAVFFGDDRYHLVVSPALCILAAGALRARRAPEPHTFPEAAAPA